MVDSSTLETLGSGNNLLAFSAGVDSTALYHLLKAKGVTFDIALVNYHTRASSNEEAKFAQTLATKDQKRCYIHNAPSFKSNFEHEARKIRYAFFEQLIAKKGYDTLITAHHLNDLLEWALMQLCKGAGVVEMVGMQPIEKRPHYTLVRPLLFVPKKDLLSYLQAKKIRYFIDESNQSIAHTRNLFRQEVANFLTDRCSEGVARSFRYLLLDKMQLMPNLSPLLKSKAFRLYRQPESKEKVLRLLDRALKELGYLTSHRQKEEIWRTRSGVLGGRWAVVIDGAYLWIAPISSHPMPKSFKERCRTIPVPPLLRPYLFEIGFDADGLERLASLLSSNSS